MAEVGNIDRLRAILGADESELAQGVEAETWRTIVSGCGLDVKDLSGRSQDGQFGRETGIRDDEIVVPTTPCGLGDERLGTGPHYDYTVEQYSGCPCGVGGVRAVQPLVGAAGYVAKDDQVSFLALRSSIGELRWPPGLRFDVFDRSLYTLRSCH